MSVNFFVNFFADFFIKFLKFTMKSKPLIVYTKCFAVRYAIFCNLHYIHLFCKSFKLYTIIGYTVYSIVLLRDYNRRKESDEFLARRFRKNEIAYCGKNCTWIFLSRIARIARRRSSRIRVHPYNL